MVPGSTGEDKERKSVQGAFMIKATAKGNSVGPTGELWETAQNTSVLSNLRSEAAGAYVSQLSSIIGCGMLDPAIITLSTSSLPRTPPHTG